MMSRTKRIRSSLVVAFVVVLGGLWGVRGAWAFQTETLPQLGKAPLEDVIAAMTLEEKVNLVVGT
ncbi:MAG TPA: hypothetical protein P5057_02330, partial [Acidobacteriota bacterium]|nr:hypothetical protein [Acidobacteriota bacterium]